MHILYLSHYYPPEVNAPANRVSQFARAWVREGHGATILTGFPNHPMGIIPPEYRGRPYVRREYDAGVTVVRVPIYVAPNRGIVRRSLTYASYSVSASILGPFITGKPDIVIATTPQFLTAVSGCWLATLKRVPFVLEVRDLWPRSIVDLGAMRPGTPMIRLLEAAEMRLYRRSYAIRVVPGCFVHERATRGLHR